jgi:hypothetical protein
MDEDYSISFDILMDAIKRMGEHGITKTDVVPTLVDFTATVAVTLGGEEAIKACIIRMIDRIKDLNAGRWPVKQEGRN